MLKIRQRFKPVIQIMGLFVRAQPKAIFGVVFALTAAILELGIVGLVGLYSSGSAAALNLKDALYASALWVKALQAHHFLVLLFCLLLIRLSLTFASQYFIIASSRRFYGQLGSAGFFRLISDIPLNALNSQSIGYYITIAGDQIARVSRIACQAGLTVIPLSLAAVYLYAMFVIDSLSMLLFLLFVVFYSLLSIPIFRLLKRLGTESDLTSKFINSTFIESLNAVATVRSLAATHVMGLRYSSGLFSYMRIHRNIELLQAASKLMPGFLLILIAIITIVLIPPTAMDAKTLLIKWMALLFAALRIFPSLGLIYSTIQIISADFNACAAVLSFIGGRTGFHENLKRLGTEPISEYEPMHSGTDTYQLSIRNVSFSHAINERKILDDVTLDFHLGSLYGICGETGVGKSSIAQLLAGLIDPTKGEIDLLRIEKGETHKQPLRGKVVMVSQAPFIISDTIRFNIEFGRRTDRSEFLQAVNRSHLQKVIDEKGGPESLLQYQGSNLSGGQKQRISLARAILKSPAAIILDETTAGLDSATKNEILRVLKSVCQTTIVILISHDVDVLKKCDHVFELGENGKLVRKVRP